MKFRPLHDRVVVKRIEEEQKTKGGIIIPDTAKEKPMQGEILAVGPGARNEDGELIPLGVAVGDRVLFGKWSGTEVKLDGDELLIMKESDIMGVLEDGAGRRQGRLTLPGPRNYSGDSTDGCQGSQVFDRRADQDAQGRHDPRRRGQGDAGPEGPQRRAREELRRAADHQGRRDRRQGDRALRQVREHGRADGARGGLEDQRRRRRRHDHRHHPGRGDRARGCEVGGRRHEPDGPQARRRPRGRGDRQGPRQPLEEGDHLGGDRPGRHDLGQRRRRDRQDAGRGDAEGRQRGRDHGRGGQEPRDRARRRRGHAVRPRLHLALLRHRQREDARDPRGALHPDPREEAVQPAGAAAGARGRGPERQAAADRGRGRRGRGAGDPGGQQAARRPQGRGRQGAGLRRSPQGDARGHRDPDRRAR